MGLFGLRAGIRGAEESEGEEKESREFLQCLFTELKA